MKFLLYAVIIVVGYFIGCIQSAYIVGRMNKIDIRKHGSNNSGASNVFMVLGWKKGVVVGLIDILKATIPVFIITRIFPNDSVLAISCGIAVVLGHIFPVFLKFKGGKGTASIIGMTLGLNPIIFLIAFAAILIVTIISDYIAIGTLAMLVSVLVALIVFDYNTVTILLFIAIAVINICLHIINFKRIIKGTESRLRGVLKKQKKE